MTNLKLAPDLTLPIDAAQRAAARIWSGIDRRSDEECWPWKRSCDTSGYGQVGVAGHRQMVSRMIFLLNNGWLPPVVMHSCDNPPCCNPAHLLAGTKALNNADKMQKGRFNPCFGDANGMRLHPESAPKGDNHYARLRPERLARGENHGCAKLTTAVVAEMRALYVAGGRTKRSIAREFGISDSHIGRILAGECWS